MNTAIPEWGRGAVSGKRRAQRLERCLSAIALAKAEALFSRHDLVATRAGGALDTDPDSDFDGVLALRWGQERLNCQPANCQPLYHCSASRLGSLSESAWR